MQGSDGRFILRCMNEKWLATLRQAADAPDLLSKLRSSGLGFVRGAFGSLPFFASTRIVHDAEPESEDATHYLLVPTGPGPDDFALVERRVLPAGVSAVNSLPKVRIFHVHDRAAFDLLESRLRDDLSVASAAGEPPPGDDFAARLEELGDIIDRRSHWLTGGLVVVGGLVAVANPLLGLGIVAKSLVPELGGRLSRFTLESAARSMRKLSASLRDSERRRAAEKEVKRMKPELVVDPFLAFIARQYALGERADPVMDELECLPEWWRDPRQRLVAGVCSEILKGDDPVGRWAAQLQSRFEGLP